MMTLEDMLDLARRSRECAERAKQEETFWQHRIAEHILAEADDPGCSALT